LIARDHLAQLRIGETHPSRSIGRSDKKQPSRQFLQSFYRQLHRSIERQFYAPSILQCADYWIQRIAGKQIACAARTRKGTGEQVEQVIRSIAKYQLLRLQPVQLG